MASSATAALDALLDARASLRGAGRWACVLVVASVACACTVGGAEEDGGARDAAPSDAAPSDAAHDAGPGYPIFFDEGLDERVIGRFEAARPGTEAPPSILYPEDGTLVPPNLAGVDLHFEGRAFDAFEITFAQGGAPSVVAYVVCRPVRGGCMLQPWRELWAAIAERRFRGPYAIAIRGLMQDAVSAPSEPISLELAKEEVEGALYFWATDPPSIRRYDFGLARRSSELYLSQRSEGTCIGCHAISRDGSRIAVGIYDEDSGFRSRIYDVATRMPILASELDAPLPSYGASDDVLLSGSPPPADGFDRPLRIVDGADGSVVHDFGVAGISADWSPDGERIIFDGLLGAGSLRELMLIGREDGVWLPPVVLATPETERESAPSFAPDSEWIGYTASRGSEHVVAAMQVSSGHLALLRRAGAGLDATWLRWNPHPYQQDGRWLFWLTFSSSRGYGVFPEGPRQIWMAAFDPEADPEDPSRPAFRFPAQHTSADNFIAEWTLEVRRQPCASDDECPDGELCRDGFCFPEGPE